MASSNAVATKDTGTEIEGFSQAELDALNAGVVGQAKSSDIVLPIIRLTQGLSKAVEDGIGKAGDFVNSLTNENYENEFEFIVSYFFYGKALSIKEPNFFGATASDRIPESWPHKDAGKLFEESDDYEDRFKALVNAGEKDWGGGPPISNTFNFVGYIPGVHEIPLRLSFMRTSAPAGQKLLTLMKMDRAMWNHPYKITSNKVNGDKGSYYVAEVERLKTASAPEDIKAAVELTRTLQQADNNSFQLHGDEDAAASPVAKATPAEGGLDLD